MMQIAQLMLGAEVGRTLGQGMQAMTGVPRPVPAKSAATGVNVKPAARHAPVAANKPAELDSDDDDDDDDDEGDGGAPGLAAPPPPRAMPAAVPSLPAAPAVPAAAGLSGISGTSRAPAVPAAAAIPAAASSSKPAAPPAFTMVEEVVEGQRQLRVQVALPGVAGMGALDLAVDSTQLRLEIEGHPTPLVVRWAVEVAPDAAKAKFVKKSSELRVTLPIV